MFNKKRKLQKIALAYILNHLGEGIIDVRKRLSILEGSSKTTSSCFKLEDKVFDLRHGWGIVKGIQEGQYPIRVAFNISTVKYTNDGRQLPEWNPTLSHHQYGLNTKPNE